jgi:hypothetical protein
MKKIIYIILFIFSTSVFSFELFKSVPFDYGESPRTNEEKIASGIVYQVMSGQPVNSEYSIVETSNLGIGNVWFNLYDDLSLHSVDVYQKVLLNSWPLTYTSTCTDSNDNCEIPWWAGRWSNQEFLEPELKDLFQYYSGDEVEIRGDGIGCLSKSPLRYGDIDDDSKNELLLFLNDNLLIFDPVLGKTVFLMLYNLDDYTSAEDTISQHGFEKPEFPQYVSRLKTNSGVAFQNDAQVTEPAFQAFAKLYTVDVNNDQIKDLLIWRKLFQSRLQSDVIKGFEKISDTYLHYKKVNGEYQLQTDTAPETIQGWLTANNQTWQSGFPSKSECSGQEGQLIPEMHDPLLNDPDVLK